MIFWFSERSRRRRIEKQAAMWVTRILDDREQHASGLRHWIGSDRERAAIYNATYRQYRASKAPAAQLFGNMWERSNWRPLDSSRYKGRHLGLAAGFVLILGGTALALALGLLDGVLHLPASEAQPGAPVVIATKIGEIRPVQLSDGSHVILDTNSVLRVAISRTSRAVQLDRGRARFQVADDGDLPFVVTAGGGTITARDTMFDVAVYRTVKVSPLSGSVDLQYPAPAPGRPRRLLRLTAGEQLGYDPLMSEEPAPPSRARKSDSQWVAGMRTFDDVPVGDIIKEANRYSTVQIELADPSFRGRRAYLDLDLRNTSDVARNLATYLGLTVDDTRPGILTLRPVE